jgi:hypothetical protein
MNHKLARVAIDLSVADHNRLKTVASLMGMTMKDLVVVSVGDFICRKLSKVTKTALLSSEYKRGVKIPAEQKTTKKVMKIQTEQKIKRSK